MLKWLRELQADLEHQLVVIDVAEVPAQDFAAHYAVKQGRLQQLTSVLHILGGSNDDRV